MLAATRTSAWRSRYAVSAGDRPVTTWDSRGEQELHNAAGRPGRIGAADERVAR
jgi:hypothetical protein